MNPNYTPASKRIRNGLRRTSPRIKRRLAAKYVTPPEKHPDQWLEDRLISIWEKIKSYFVTS